MLARHTQGCFECGVVNPSVAHATAPLSGAPGLVTAMFDCKTMPCGSAALVRDAHAARQTPITTSHR